ncbi:unnamed protein product [Penicillium nalgiovense]|nr:unnamed protein product [Penicillium nalgiovense]
MASDTVASIKTSLEHEHNACLVLVPPETLDKHYGHYCQRLAWPILNSQIPDCPRNHAYEESSWEEYVQVNQAFADEIVAKWHPGDFIWIHDYHLALIPGLVRKEIPDSVIGFFFHSSFPPSEVFRCLAGREQILAGVLGADIVGFQTEEHRLHFVRSCRRLLSVDVSVHTVHFEGRVVWTRTFPIGIDIARLLETFQNPITGEWIKDVQREFFGKSLVVGRDRLDGVTGVKQKLLIYEHFLDSYSEWVGKVVLVQVALPCPGSSSIFSEVSSIAMRINSKHASLTYQPVVLLTHEIPFAQYLALLAISKACLVTSLQEAMNLVTHDFICCHASSTAYSDRGVLVVSEFAGSATDFEQAAFVINPWDRKACAHALKDALELIPQEAERRLHILYHTACERDAARWCRGFMSTLEGIEVRRARHIVESQLDNSKLFQTCCKPTSGSSVIIVSDDHGPTENHKDKFMGFLGRAAHHDDSTVYVVSSLPKEHLEETLQALPEIGIITEDGSVFRKPGGSKWDSFRLSTSLQRYPAIDAVIDYFQERTPGSNVRRTDYMAMFSFPKDDKHALRQAVGLAENIIGCYGSDNIRVVQAADAVAIFPAQASWSQTLRFLLQKSLANLHSQGGQYHQESMSMLLVGDGILFEDIIRWAKEEEALLSEVTHIYSVAQGF